MLFRSYKGLSRGASRTVRTALRLAGQQGCATADTGHLLLAMLQTAQGPAADFLRRKRVTTASLTEAAPKRSGTGQPHRLRKNDLSSDSRKAIEFAILGAHASSAAKAENEHLLCAMLEDTACTASIWLAAAGIEVPQAARECRQLSGQMTLPVQPRMSTARSGRPSEKYGRDLTRLAQEGRLDPVLCREEELERMVEILCRRQKNNPCLLGEPGVGKSALAEALAQAISSGQITPALRGKRVLALDMASMVAGTKYRGDFEERFKNLLEELYRDRSTILFIDEIHLIAGAGAAEGAIDAASILKPMLARGEIQLIGATTPEEYRKTIQKDSALERRFGKVMVEEPTPENAEKILLGLMPRYERYHCVAIPPETIHAAVELSVRYLPGRFLPDKAIDLLDEAAAALRITDKESSGRRVLTPRHIARVVSKASGVPAERVGEAERERLNQLEARLSAEVIGQPAAVSAVAAAIRRSRAGVSPKRKPVSFIFVGPTGVGKTELVKCLAADLFDTPDALIRLDMSEYMEKHSVSKLIGAPPGYVGYDEAGQLTEKIRRRPYSVVLFDEIEKAHPDVLNVLLQILDDGVATDAQGRKVSFENTVIIMTSNAGSDRNQGAMGFGGTVTQQSQEKAMKALQEIMRPEFINRIDQVVAFNQLNERDFAAIARIMLGDLQETLQGNGIDLKFDDLLVDFLVKKSYSIKYGARNLRRFIQKEIEDRAASAIISAYQNPITSISLSSDGEQILMECH